jgi:hypothetical protein
MLLSLMRGAARLASLGLAALILSGAPVVCAQGKAKPPARATTKTKKPAAKPATKQPSESEEPAAADTKPDVPAGAPEGAVKAAGTKAGKEPEKTGDQARVTDVEESAKDKGVKTYKFSAVEVEGRLKSPQIVYFLRRVRAEFEAGALGHRSFMPELSDSRRNPALK